MDSGRQPLILLADGRGDYRSMLRALLEHAGYEVLTADSGTAVLERVRQRLPDVLILDSRLPEVETPELVRTLKSYRDLRGKPVLVTGPAESVRDRVEAGQAGADDFIPKPFRPEDILIRLRLALEQSEMAQELEYAERLLMNLVASWEARNPHTRGHCERVAQMSRRLGQRLMLSQADIEALYKGGFLHDIGMLKVPREITDKPGTLTPEESEQMKMHTIWGERMCRPLRSLRSVLPIVRYHHEQYDGSGYPDGLRGEQIPLLARILQVVEIFDSLLSDRPYRARLPRADAMRVLREYASRQWLDPALVDEFLRMVEQEDWPEVPEVERRTPAPSA